MSVSDPPLASVPPASTSQTPEPDLSRPFGWQAHPARERPWVALLACVVVFSFALAVYGLTQWTVWAVGTVLVFFASLNRFFFATRYRLDRDGISASMLLGQRHLLWNEIRRVEFGARAAWLSPLPRRSWREHRRGIHVLFGGRSVEVVAQLRARLATACACPDLKD